MANKLKRDPIKYVRDRAKAAYKKDTECCICGTDENLEFHHYYTMTPLFNKWLRDNKFTANTEEEILAVRDKFIEDNRKHIYEDTVTLCKTHHMKLHSIYGKDPSLVTATKQMNWVQIQREKNGLTNMDV